MKGLEWTYVIDNKKITMRRKLRTAKDMGRGDDNEREEWVYLGRVGNSNIKLAKKVTEENAEIICRLIEPYPPLNVRIVELTDDVT